MRWTRWTGVNRWRNRSAGSTVAAWISDMLAASNCAAIPRSGMSLVNRPGRDAIVQARARLGAAAERGRPGAQGGEADQPQQIFAASSDVMLVTPVAGLSVTSATPV